MKKYIISIIAIGAIITLLFTVKTVNVTKLNKKEFPESGYILQSSEDQKLNIDRYYFDANAKYKVNYQSNVEFNDTDGNKVKTNSVNFIHYSNGSISALANGAIINLTQIDENPIIYYNINKGQILKKQNNMYSIDNMGQQLGFSQFIWKLSDNKYLIADASNLKLNLGDDTDTKTIKGYLEIEYSANEVVKVFNQEVSYMTISPNAYIETSTGTRLYIEDRIVNYQDENKMGLESLVINSEDDVKLRDLDAYKNGNTTNDTNDTNEMNNTNETTAEETQGEKESSSSSSSTSVVSGGTIGGQTQIVIQNDDDQGSQSEEAETESDNQEENNTNTENTTTNTTNITEEEIDDTIGMKIPTFTINDFETTSTGFSAIVKVTDTDSVLTSDNTIIIREIETGKKVYEDSSEKGTYDFNVEVNNLNPNTQYVLQISSSYELDEIEYEKNFIYKTFKTLPVGITLLKDVYTQDQISVQAIFDKNSEVKTANVSLYNEEGTKVAQDVKITNSNDGTGDSKAIATFTGLNSNTSYIARVENAVYNGQIIQNGFDIHLNVKTLKKPASISNPDFEIDKINSAFNMKARNIADPDSGIISYRFDVYNGKTSTLVESIETSKPEETIKIDDEKYIRKTPYYFVVVAEFYDNEKQIEIKSEPSQTMIMNSDEMPSVSWQEDEVTWEKIKGTIVIKDPSGTVSLKPGDKITVQYSTNQGQTLTLTSAGSLTIPININNLKANSTYKFEVRATVDLHESDEPDPIENQYIGSFTVNTKETDKLRAKLIANSSDTENVFSVNFKLDKVDTTESDLALNTLSKLYVSLYVGQSVDGSIPAGEPKVTKPLIDENEDPYVSDLKADLYDSKAGVNITPKFFGNNYSNDSFQERYYTIVVGDPTADTRDKKGSSDYTTYRNKIPIQSNVYTIKTNGSTLSLPEDPENAIDVTVIRNRDVEKSRNDLDAETIVGYRLQAVTTNANANVKQVIYDAYNSQTGEKIASSGYIDVSSSQLALPTYTFNLSDGVQNDDGKALRRGNKFYFTYRLKIEQDGEIIDWPTASQIDKTTGKTVVLKSETMQADKQIPTMLMEPSSSTSNSVTVKYLYKDVDFALVDRNLIAQINNIDISTNALGDEQKVNTVTFTGLTKGILEIKSLEKLNVDAESRKYETYFVNVFEGEKTLGEINFSKTEDDSKVQIRISGDTSNIVAYRVSFTPEDSSVSPVVLDYQIAEDGKINIPKNKLKTLVGKKSTITVTAYYDSGLFGTDFAENNGQVVIRKTRTGTDQNITYYAIDDKTKTLATSQIIDGNMYIANIDWNKYRVTLKNPINGYETTLTFNITKEGIRYDGNVIISNEVKTGSISARNTSDSTITIDIVYPTVSLQNNGELQIVPELTAVAIHAKIDSPEAISDGKIILNLYKTDEEWRNPVLVSSTMIELNKINDVDYRIENLEPKAYYGFTLSANVKDTNGKITTQGLYDTDYDVKGKQYYFSTLNDIEITNVEVKYSPVSYNEKYLNITYNIDRVVGFKEIEYKLEKFDSATQTYVDTGIEIPNDVQGSFDKSMKKKISINPGQSDVIKFRKKYRITINPIAEAKDSYGNVKRYDVGTKKQEFTLSELQNPIVYINASRTNDNIASFKVTIYDNDKVVPDTTYTAHLYKINDKAERTEELELTNSVGTKITEGQVKDYNFEFKYTGSSSIKNDAFEFVIETNVDLQNNGQTTKYSKSKTLRRSNDYGIDIGDVNTTTLLNDGQYKIGLVFTNSYKLEDVDELRWTIYNANGFTVSGSDTSFTPIASEVSTDTKRYTINNDISNYPEGTYQVMCQFVKNGEVIDTIQLQHVYLHINS